MDVEKNPGPTTITNYNWTRNLESTLFCDRSFESSSLSSTSHLDRHIAQNANSSLRFVYSKTELLSIRFRQRNLKPSMSLWAHVCDSTHRAGHTLDLLITRNDETLIDCISGCDPHLSEHFAVTCKLVMAKPSFAKKKIEFRKIKSIDLALFNDDILNSSLVRNLPDKLDSLVALYDSELSAILASPCAYYTDDIKYKKRTRRKFDRRWRATRLPIARERYVRQCSLVKDLLSSSRSK